MGLILFLVIFSDQGNYEFFDGISEKDLKNINEGVNSVISCKKEGESCGEDKVRNFNEFKKRYGYKKFNTMFFLKLLRKRKEMDKDFSASEINKLIKEGDYGDSLQVIETMDGGDTVKNDCIQSIRDFKQAIEESHAEDKRMYEKKLKEWEDKKAAIELEFNSNPDRWEETCKRIRCEPADEFFDAHPNTAIYNHLIAPSFPADRSTCMAACRSSANCDFVSWANGMCDLKGIKALLGIGSNPGMVSGIKTSTGFRRIKGGYGDHYHFNLKPALWPWWDPSPSVEDCEKKCAENKDCHWYSYALDPHKKCSLKNDGPLYHAYWSAFKKKVATFKFNDGDPYITEKIGKKPKIEYSPVPVAEFVCMDCSSNMRDVTSEESKDVAINQLNQCVGKMRGAPQRPSGNQLPPPPQKQPPANTTQETKAETTTTTGGLGTGTVVGAAVGGTTSIVSSSSFFAILLIGGIYFATRK